mgnify:CR=1 FL=1
MHSIHRAPLKIAAKPPPQPSAPKAVKLKNPWAHRAHPSYEPSSLNLLNPGPSVAHPAAPFRLAALATHPPGRGWAGNMEEKNVASNRHIPFYGGKRVPRPSNLPPTARRGEGDHEMVEGGCRRRHYKKTAAKPPPSPSARRAVNPKNLTNPRGKAPSTLIPKVCYNKNQIS